MTQREDQRTYIGGGDIASIIGVGYKTPLYVWARKTGREPEPEVNLKMQVGLLLEDFVLSDFEKSHGVELLCKQQFFRVDEYCGGHIDGLCDIDGVQVVVDAKIDTMTYGFETLPKHYQAQAQWYMHVTQSQRAMFHVAHLPAGRMQTYTLERDDETIEWMRKEAASLWLYVQLDTPPPTTDADTHKDWSRWVEPAPKQSLICDDALAADVRECAAIKLSTRDAERRERILSERIKIAMGGAEELYGPDGVRLATKKINKKGSATLRIAGDEQEEQK